MEKEKEVSRRDFLKTASVVGAASSLGTMVAPHIMTAQSVGIPPVMDSSARARRAARC